MHGQASCSFFHDPRFVYSNGKRGLDSLQDEAIIGLLALCLTNCTPPWEWIGSEAITYTLGDRLPTLVNRQNY
jgi:hypothetical protein